MANVLFVLAIFASWLTAVVHDAAHSVFGWLLVDIFVAPLGMVRGLLMWAGVV